MKRWIQGLTLLSLGLLAGCGGSTQTSQLFTTYDQEAVVILNTDGALVQSTVTSRCNLRFRSCLTVTREGEHCRGIERGPVDILVDNRTILAQVCYGTQGGKGLQRVDLNWDTTLRANNQIVLFDFSTIARRYTTPLIVEGNRVTIYGNGPQQTIFVGHSQIKGNNVYLRALHVYGDVVLQGNNASLFFVVVHGNLSVTGNNAVLGQVVVHGDLNLQGNNHTLMWVDVSGQPRLSGNTYRCQLTRHFSDFNRDNTFTPPSERTTPWECPLPGQDKGPKDKGPPG